MRTQRDPPLFLFLAVFVAVPIHTATLPGPVKQRRGGSSTEFIRVSCSHTPYANICYATLAGSSKYTGNNPSCLAMAAIYATAKQARQLKKRLEELSHENPYVAPGENDGPSGCLQDMRHAAFLTRDSLQRMQNLSIGVNQISPQGRRRWLAYETKRVTSWMNNAIADERTCIERFMSEGEESGASIDNISGKTIAVIQSTRIALALIENYMKAKGLSVLA